MELADFSHVFRLILQPADEQFVRAICEVHGSDEQYGFPMLATFNDDGCHCAYAAGNHEACAAPEEVVAPHAEQAATRRHSDRARNEDGVHDEVGADSSDERL